MFICRCGGAPPRPAGGRKQWRDDSRPPAALAPPPSAAQYERKERFKIRGVPPPPPPSSPLFNGPKIRILPPCSRAAACVSHQRRRSFPGDNARFIARPLNRRQRASDPLFEFEVFGTKRNTNNNRECFHVSVGDETLLNPQHAPVPLACSVDGWRKGSLPELGGATIMKNMNLVNIQSAPPESTAVMRMWMWSPVDVHLLPQKTVGEI